MLQEKDTIILIISGTIVLVIISVFIILIIFSIINKNRKYISDKQKLEQQFKQTLLQTQLEIQDQTFNTVSHEIHDNVGQLLSLAKVQLNIISQAAAAEIPLLGDAKESINKAITDLRDIAKGMNSERVQRIGLTEAVGDELNRINRSGILTANITVNGVEGFLEPQKKIILFRIIQESFQNILKHASASTLSVVFNYVDGILKIGICDNGKGFNVAQEQQAGKGLGLQNMRNRASLIGGKLIIDSAVANGTTINITIPYE